MTEHILDARGLMCPEPVHKAERLLRELAPGATVTVLTTDPAAAIDFEAWCQMKGHTFKRCEDSGPWLEILIQKSTA